VMVHQLARLARPCGFGLRHHVPQKEPQDS
jgi:hypothetical protein